MQMKLNFLKQKHFDHANQAHSHREVYAAVPPNGPPLPTSCPYSWLEGLLASQPGRNESISMAGRPASKTGCRNRKTWHSHLSCHVVSLQAPIFHLPLSLTVALHGHSWFQPPKSHDLFYTKKSYERQWPFCSQSSWICQKRKKHISRHWKTISQSIMVIPTKNITLWLWSQILKLDTGYLSKIAHKDLNGALSDGFQIEKGTSHGSPLFPIFKILVLEVFTSKIRKDPKTEGFKINGEEFKDPCWQMCFWQS